MHHAAHCIDSELALLHAMQSLQYGVDLRGGELDSMGMPLFRPLTTYSWEQSDGLVKIYVPLRGVQTELLRLDNAICRLVCACLMIGSNTHNFDHVCNSMLLGPAGTWMVHARSAATALCAVHVAKLLLGLFAGRPSR